MDATFAALGEERGGLALRCANTIPHGRGSARPPRLWWQACCWRAPWCATVRDRLDDAAVLASPRGSRAIPTMRRPRSSGASRSPGPSRRRPLRYASSRRSRCGLLVLLPDSTLATATARGLLPRDRAHVDAAHAAARSALLVHAITAEPDLLLAATEDRLHQAYRGPAMPHDPRSGRPGSGRPGWLPSSPALAPACSSWAVPELTEARVAGAANARRSWPVRAVDLDRGGARVEPDGRRRTWRRPNTWVGERIGVRWCYAQHRTRCHPRGRCSATIPGTRFLESRMTTVASR